MMPAKQLAALWHFQRVIYMFQHSLPVRALQTEAGDACKSSGKAAILLDLWNLLWDVVIYQEMKNKGHNVVKI